MSLFAGNGQGSIPACTGEPIAADVAGGMSEVYPRVYGGTRPISWSATAG